MYPYSAYHRGICRADIFVEITRIADCKSIWAQFKQIPVHPTLIKRIGYLNAQHITVFKTCCIKYIRVDWEAAGVQLYHNDNPIRLPAVGTVSLWSASDLLEVNTQEQYTIRLLGRVSDQIYDIPVDTELMMGAARGPEFRYEEETEVYQGQLRSAPVSKPQPILGSPKVRRQHTTTVATAPQERELLTPPSGVHYYPMTQKVLINSPPAYSPL